MIDGILKILGWAFLAALAFVAFLVIYIFGGFYIVRPLHHRFNVMVAERANNKAYESGSAYVFDVAFAYEIDGVAGSQMKRVTCYPKKEAQNTFKSGAMTWDTLRPLDPNPVHIDLRGRQDLVFDRSQLNCSTMVKAYREGETAFPVSSIYGPWLTPRDGGDAIACAFRLEGDEQVIGGLAIHRPHVMRVEEVPIHDLMTRERYGPADRRLMGEAGQQLNGLKGLAGVPVRFHWRPNQSCWENSRDFLARFKESRQEPLRRERRPICSVTGQRACGFP